MGHELAHVVALGGGVLGVAADVEVEPGAVGEEDVAGATPRHDLAEQVARDLVGRQPALAVERARDAVLVLDSEDASVHDLTLGRIRRQRTTDDNCNPACLPVPHANSRARRDRLARRGGRPPGAGAGALGDLPGQGPGGPRSRRGDLRGLGPGPAHGLRAGQRSGLGPRAGRLVAARPGPGRAGGARRQGASTGSTCPPARSTPTTAPRARTRAARCCRRSRAARRPREEYGAAKVACERLCTEAVGDRLLVARAGLIGGYGDLSDRFGYWPGRMALAARDGGPVLVPAEQDAPVQVVDVGDLARWLVDAGAAGAHRDRSTRSARGAPWRRRWRPRGRRPATPGELVPAPSRWLREQGVEEFMGPRSLPLWLADPDWAGFSARSGAAASAAGLSSPAAGRPGRRQPAVGARAGAGPRPAGRG